MLLQKILNALNGNYVIDYQMVINLNCQAFKFNITLKVAADITVQYLLHIYMSLLAL